MVLWFLAGASLSGDIFSGRANTYSLRCCPIVEIRYRAPRKRCEVRVRPPFLCPFVGRWGVFFFGGGVSLSFRFLGIARVGVANETIDIEIDQEKRVIGQFSPAELPPQWNPQR